MTVHRSKKKPVVLFIVWLFSCLVLTAFNKYNQLFLKKDQTITQYYISLAITILVTVIYFIPMLVVIYRQAKAVSLKWLIIVAKSLLVLFSGVLAILLIILLCMLVAQ